MDEGPRDHLAIRVPQAAGSGDSAQQPPRWRPSRLTTVPCAQSSWTDIFIYRAINSTVDHLVTSFHLPESTLMMLISAFATREMVMNAYQEAIKEEYRFFSFGDSMLLY